MPSLFRKDIAVDEYLQMDAAAEEKHEYAGGEVRIMDGETIEHNEVAANVLCKLGSFLKGKDFHIYPSRMRLTTPGRMSYFYPDVTIVHGRAQLQHGIFDTLLNPLLIIEIVSDESETIDRGYKFFHYQQIPSLQEYVLVDSREHVVDVIRRKADGLWKFDKYGLADEQFHLASIHCTLSFANVYYRVQLPMQS